MPATVTAPERLSPAEYITALSPDERMEALVALLGVVPSAAGGAVPITLRGHLFGHFVPLPKGEPAELRRILANVSPEREAEMRRALATPGDSISFDEMLAELRPAAPTPGQ